MREGGCEKGAARDVVEPTQNTHTLQLGTRDSCVTKCVSSGTDLEYGTVPSNSRLIIPNDTSEILGPLESFAALRNGDPDSLARRWSPIDSSQARVC